MNIISFLGSPRKNGNTAVLLNKVLEGILSEHEVQSETVFLQDRNIKPCRGCESCKKNESKVCVIDDDMKELMGKIKKADLIVIATPIYWWGVTAQMKLLVDRLYAVDYSNKSLKLSDKKVLLLMTYGGELPNSGPETVESNFKEICEYINVGIAGVLGVCTEKSNVCDNAEALKQAFEFGKKVL